MEQEAISLHPSPLFNRSDAKGGHGPVARSHRNTLGGEVKPPDRIWAGRWGTIRVTRAAR